jgi:hypothetical protein
VTTPDAGALVAQLGELARTQMPYAHAQALTTLAFDAQRASKLELARAMTLRNPFSAAGLQVVRAEKRDWPHQSAQLGIEQRRSYLIDHVLGAKRQGGRHGRAIPADESLRSPRGKVPKGKRPAVMIQRAGRRPGGRRKGAKTGQHRTPLPFLLYASKWGNEVIARRMGPERYPLLIVYAFKRDVTVRPEFDMIGHARDAVGANYERVYGQALARAIASAKSKGERKASTSRDQRIDRGT